MDIDDILKPWTTAHCDAARREGWDLHTATDGPAVQVQRIGDPEELPSGIATHLPSDAVALAMVRCGTGEHHAVARQIIHDHFPAEWAYMEKCYAEVFPQPKE